MSRFLSIVGKLMFVDEFFEQYDEVYESKNLLVSYCLIGGFCFDKRVKLSFKVAWTLYNVWNTFFVCVCCISYLFDLLVYDFSTIIVGVLPLLGVWGKWVLYFGLYLYREKFDRIITAVLNKDGQTEVPNDYKNGVSLSNWMTTVVMLATALLFFLVIDVKQLFNQQIKITQNAYLMYFHPVPWPYEENFYMELFVRVLQFVISLADIIFLISDAIFRYTATIEIHDKFRSNCHDLRIISKCTFEEMDKLIEAESEAFKIIQVRGRQWECRRLQRKKDAELQNFCIGLKQFIQKVQELKKLEKFVTECFMIKISLAYCSLLAAMFGYASLLATFQLNEDASYISLFQLCLSTAVVVYIWWNCCLEGQLIKETNELVLEEVYSSPWYHLDPKERKIVSIVLSLFQPSKVIRAFGIFPISFNTVPEVLNKVYSYVQIVRTLQQKYYH